MEKIKIDGVEYDVPSQVASTLRSTKARADAAEGALKEVSAKVAAAEAKADTAQAKADAAMADLAGEKKARLDSVEATKAEIRSRIELERTAGDVLGTGVKLDGVKDTEIKVQVLSRLDADFVAAGKSEAYVAARFDIAMEKYRAENPALDALRVAAAAPGKPAPRLDDDSPRKEFMKKNAAGYLQPLAGSIEE